jgi:hypothetical protein
VKVNGGGGKSYSQSYLMATLVQGQSYTIPGSNQVIKAQKIDIIANPAVATISVTSSPVLLN